MQTQEARERMRKTILFTERAHTRPRSRRQQPSNPAAANEEAVPLSPPAYPVLSLSEYAARDYIPKADHDLDFFLACKQGDLPSVTHYTSSQLNEATLQYGLEQASFNNQHVIARHLLSRGAKIHTAVFERIEPRPSDSEGISPGSDVCIFDKHPGEQLIPLIRVFLEAGWHPDQYWLRPSTDTPRVALLYPACVRSKPLVEFLLSHGADPNIAFGINGAPFMMAVKAFDPSLLEVFISHGVDVNLASPLHSIAESRTIPRHPENPLMPFSQRRATAEYLLTKGVGINDVKKLPSRSLLSAPPGSTFEEDTALTVACAAEDWEFVEWLLEKGADADLLEGKALKRQWWMAPYVGPNDPGVVKRLVEKVKQSQKQS